MTSLKLLYESNPSLGSVAMNYTQEILVEIGLESLLTEMEANYGKRARKRVHGIITAGAVAAALTLVLVFLALLWTSAIAVFSVVESVYSWQQLIRVAPELIFATLGAVALGFVSSWLGGKIYLKFALKKDISRLE